MINLRVERDELEDVVRAIPLALAEFNESYPQWIAAHERGLERKKAMTPLEQEHRFDAEQQAIDESC